MSGLLLKIYEQIVSQEQAAYKGRKRTEEWAEELLRKYAAEYGPAETEPLRSLLYAVSLKAEQEGFQLGIQFAFRLSAELYPHHRELYPDHKA